MKLKWIGHACFLTTSDEGTKVMNDPYEPGFMGLINYSKIEDKADIIAVSHAHGDHAAVLAVPGQHVVVQGPGTHRVKGVELTGVSTFHDKVNGKERGQNTIFCFTVDGIRICHLGDLGHALDASTVAAIGKVHVLLVPTGGPAATMDLPDAWQVCDAIKPRLIVPMHFKNDKCPFPKYTVDEFIKGKANVKRAGAAEVSLSAGKLPKATEVLVLDHAC